MSALRDHQQNIVEETTLAMVYR